MLESNIIGEGMDGLIFKSGFGTRSNYVSKFGRTPIFSEFQKIEQILMIPEHVEFPINIEGSSLKILDYRDKQYFIKILENRNDPSISYARNEDIYQLQIPYISGCTLFFIFEQYKAEYYKHSRSMHRYTNEPLFDDYREENKQLNDSKPYMTVKIFCKLFKALIKLFKAVKTMNNLGVFHNDIHENNIIANDDGDLYLIDFSRVTFGAEIPDEYNEDDENEYHPDQPKTLMLLGQCIWYACENPLLYLWFQLKDVIPNNISFNPNDELRQIIETFISDEIDNETFLDELINI